MVLVAALSTACFFTLFFVLSCLRKINKSCLCKVTQTCRVFLWQIMKYLHGATMLWGNVDKGTHKALWPDLVKLLASRGLTFSRFQLAHLIVLLQPHFHMTGNMFTHCLVLRSQFICENIMLVSSIEKSGQYLESWPTL